MPNSRELIINNAPFNGDSVVYVMSRDQRVHDNHALLAAQILAKDHNVALYVVFVLKHVPGRFREQYAFMLHGLEEVAVKLSSLNIAFVLRTGQPEDEILKLCSEVNAGAIYFDFSPLHGARKLIKQVASKFHGTVTVVDTHNIIPVWIASDKQEFAAHTMRAKVHQKLEQYLVEPEAMKPHSVAPKPVESLSNKEAIAFIDSIPSNGSTIHFRPGEAAAQTHLGKFITSGLKSYAQARNDFSVDHQSGLSPYLHFGHISSLRVALNVLDAVQKIPLLLTRVKLAEHGEQPSLEDGMNALFEEMIVRKELSDNFCFYTKDYRSLSAAPNWAQASLAEHATNARDFVYDLSEWETARTHDKIWNAAQTELTKTGKMHGYLRMYWAKKILEWSKTPEEALKTAIYLNDKYSIDGGDPNGYVGILWSIAGLHDRPWFERPVFGKIRYMNEAGLRRKFDVESYIKRIGAL